MKPKKFVVRVQLKDTNDGMPVMVKRVVETFDPTTAAAKVAWRLSKARSLEHAEITMVTVEKFTRERTVDIEMD